MSTRPDQSLTSVTCEHPISTIHLLHVVVGGLASLSSQHRGVEPWSPTAAGIPMCRIQLNTLISCCLNGWVAQIQLTIQQMALLNATAFLHLTVFNLNNYVATGIQEPRCFPNTLGSCEANACGKSSCKNHFKLIAGGRLNFDKPGSNIWP